MIRRICLALALTLALWAPVAPALAQTPLTLLELKISLNRHFAFSAASPYAVENLILEVQQPAGASAFTGVPQWGNMLPGPDGLTYYSIIRSQVPAQDQIRLDLAYTKSASALTVGSASAGGGDSSTGALPAPVTPAAQTPAWLYGLLGLGAILLVVGGLIWYARPRMRNNRAGRLGRRKTANGPSRLRTGKRASRRSIATNAATRAGPATVAVATAARSSP